MAVWCELWIFMENVGKIQLEVVLPILHVCIKIWIYRIKIIKPASYGLFHNPLYFMFFFD